MPEPVRFGRQLRHDLGQTRCKMGYIYIYIYIVYTYMYITYMYAYASMSNIDLHDMQDCAQQTAGSVKQHSPSSELFSSFMSGFVLYQSLRLRFSQAWIAVAADRHSGSGWGPKARVVPFSCSFIRSKPRSRSKQDLWKNERKHYYTVCKAGRVSAPSANYRLKHMSGGTT